MFVRVKKIGAYEYLYLVENAREDAVSVNIAPSKRRGCPPKAGLPVTA